MSQPPPDPDGEIIFTRHAADRLAERYGRRVPDSRREVREAVRAGRVEHRRQNVWYIYGDEGRRYPVAVIEGKLLVMTVLPPHAAAEAA